MAEEGHQHVVQARNDIEYVSADSNTKELQYKKDDQRVVQVKNDIEYTPADSNIKELQHKKDDQYVVQAKNDIEYATADSNPKDLQHKKADQHVAQAKNDIEFASTDSNIDKELQYKKADQHVVQAKTDVESGSSTSGKELQHKKRMRRLYYVAAFAVLQTVVILVLALTIMRIKTPKFRIRSVTIDELSISSSDSNNDGPSINMKFEAEIGFKNTNFGHFKFEGSSINFMYRGTKVGDAMVHKGKVKARSTKKIHVTAEMGTTNWNVASDIESGSLTLTSQAKMSGTVHLMKLVEKKRSAEMNCTITVDLKEKVVRYLNCK
ncbi:Late embryogenesis abundant protein [Parasponia andersonii]|uniref:Late embryogenesis abundant protein n=1 Tax=Parasponia andersonii TaxID=3476 RepID=A0A2P5CB58_PARAD|nr:Late embryogenesis abundant protein [Parasponia andersonii]